MATPYLDRAALEALLGASVVAQAEVQNEANIDAVIASQCALVDGYVACQMALPPNPTAMAQLAPLVAELVYCTLYINSGNAELTNRRKLAQATLADIAARPPRMVLFNPQTIATEPVEADGASAGSSGNRWFTNENLSKPTALPSSLW